MPPPSADLLLGNPGLTEAATEDCSGNWGLQQAYIVEVQILGFTTHCFVIPRIFHLSLAEEGHNFYWAKQMANSSPSKELLGFEKRKPPFKESKLVMCDNDVALSLKKGQINDVAEVRADGRTFSADSLPKSQLLGKMKDFLGLMAEANRQLELDVQENPKSNHNIEVLTGDEEECIEMDLLLGVADLQTPEAVAAAEAAIYSGSLPSVAHSSGGGELDSDGSELDSDGRISGDDGDNLNENNPISRKLPSESIKSSGGPRQKKRPKIVVLG